MKIKHLIADNIAFHCNTEEKANEFIKKAYSLGYKWCSGGKDNDSYFYMHTKFTCYKLHYDKTISFGYISFFIENGYKIIEYELDTVKKKKTPWKPKDRELVWSIDCDGDTYSTNFFETYKNDLAMLKCGWYFKTKAEAESNRERVLKEYSEVLGDE